LIEFKSKDGCRVLLIGGPPFPEQILMWWNFVARTPEEIEQARADWLSHQRLGEVKYRRPRSDASPLKRVAPPNPARSFSRHGEWLSVRSTGLLGRLPESCY